MAAAKSKAKGSNNTGGKWTRLGTLRKRLTNAGVESPYIVLNKNYMIVERETGTEVDLGQYMQIKLINPVKGLESMKANGIISEEDFDKQMAFIEEKNVKFELTVPPNNDGN